MRHSSYEEEGGNGADYHACRRDIIEIKTMVTSNTDALRDLALTVDERVAELIRLLDKRLEGPWSSINRAMLFMAVVMLAFVGFVFVHEHGLNGTKELVESIRK